MEMTRSVRVVMASFMPTSAVVDVAGVLLANATVIINGKIYQVLDKQVAINFEPKPLKKTWTCALLFPPMFILIIIM